MKNEVSKAAEGAKLPEFVFMTMWMLADMPEQFHPLIEELFKQGKIKLILDCPPHIM